ncbi:MAG: riboflavin kinase [bacterium]
MTKLTGKVVKGFARGRLLGFPTANMELLDKDQTLPKQGVYVSLVRILDKKYESRNYFASCNLGKALTFGATIDTIEPHLLDFNEDIYGKIIEVELIKYLRPMKKFVGQEELKKALSIDVFDVRRFFN